MGAPSPLELALLQRLQQGNGTSAPPTDMTALLTAMRNDPQGDHNRQWTMTGPGGGFDMAKNAGFFGPSISPEAGLASQGPTAMNQWAQAGQVPGIDQNMFEQAMMQRNTGPLALLGNNPGEVTGHSGYEQHTPTGVSRIPNQMGGYDMVGQPSQQSNMSMLYGQSQPRRMDQPNDWQMPVPGDYMFHNGQAPSPLMPAMAKRKTSMSGLLRR